MSEHYDFHYQPTGSGAISGQQVLQQTEDAINELGDYVNDNVGGAMDVAQQALETAQNAEQDAQTALDTANSFSSAIQSAQQDASTALSTAQTAQTTATNASNTAIQAQQDASSAVTTANNASGQVSTLSGTVTALGQRVTTAEGNIGQNTSDITALGQRVTTAEGNITTLQNDVTIAQGNASSAMATAGQVKQQAFVFRYSSTALTASSTNSNTLLDNTDNLKVGDKVIDSDGVLFSITAIDTANSTFTVGSALVDLALDANVVHTSGNETISGAKTFSSNINVYNSDPTATTPNLYLKSSKIELSSQGNTSGNQNLTYLDKNNTTYAYVKGAIQSSGSAVKIRTIAKDSSDNSVVNELQMLAYTNGNKAVFPTYSNEVDLGVSSYKWKSVYATNYYYGSNNVEFSTKFVTTDTTQTISGNKTFSSNVNVYNSDSSTDTANIVLKNSKAEIGTEFSEQSINFIDKNNNPLAKIGCYGTVGAYTRLYITAFDSNNNSDGFYIRKSSTGTTILPTTSSSVAIGNSTFPYYNVQTNKVNSLEPSSLSLPSDRSARIDISSYITNLGDGNFNTYTVPANGYIWLSFTGVSRALCYSKTSDELTNYAQTFARNGDGLLNAFFPVRKNDKFMVQISTSSTAGVQSAYFIPCQGNV